jgi:hypothetical protein
VVRRSRSPQHKVRLSLAERFARAYRSYCRPVESLRDICIAPFHVMATSAVRAEHFASRSAVNWPGEIDVPVLLLHSRSDSRVPVEHTLKLAALLQ